MDRIILDGKRRTRWNYIRLAFAYIGDGLIMLFSISSYRTDWPDKALERLLWQAEDDNATN